MRSKLILAAVGLCVCLSGCRLAFDAAHNVAFETCLFYEDMKAKVCYPLQASTAWKEYAAHNPDKAASGDFGHGFRQGYADYLENGGDCCNSHPLPPMRYWKLRNETPEGRAATNLWSAGFRTGAMAAKAGGQRALIVVPVGDGYASPPLAGSPSLAPPPSDPPLASPTAPRVSPIPAAPAPRPMEELPKPQAIPSAPSLPTNAGDEAAGRRLVPLLAASRKPTEDGDKPPRELPQWLPHMSPQESPPPAQASKGQPSFTRIKEDIQHYESSMPERKKTPRDPRPHYEVAMIALKAGADKEALRWFYSALEEDPNHVPTHAALAEYYRKTGDFYRATEHRVKAGLPLDGKMPSEQ